MEEERAIIEVLAIGTLVETVVGKIVGVITGICIRGITVQYEVSYFDEKVYVHIWMDRTEFKTRSKQIETQKIGF